MISIKKRIRKEVQRKEKTLSVEYKESGNQQIYEQIIRLPEYQMAGTLFCFISRSNEVNTHSMIEKAWKEGKTVCVPRCLRPGHMHAYAITSWDDVEPGMWGIEEPVSSCLLIEPSQIDFALIPCCSAWKDGRRLGFGGGYYDRYVEQETFIKAVVCRQALMRKDIPMAPFDQRMDIVINENRVYRVSRK